MQTFLKWEQLAAYARAAVNRDYAFRGTERVQSNLRNGKTVTVSAEPAHQILSNQKIYGLWGLYSVPARASGLLDGDPPRLTAPAMELVEREYLPRLATGAGRDARQIREFLSEKSSRLDVNGKHAKMLKAVGDVHSRELRKAERTIFRDHLLHGGPSDETKGRQRLLAEVLTETLSRQEWEWSPASVNGLAREAGDRSEPHSLAYHLDRIATCESVLAPVSMLYGYLLGLDGKTSTEVAKRLRDEWGNSLPNVRANDFRDLRNEIANGDSDTGDRWVNIADALAAGKYLSVVDLLLAQNKAVMDARHGGPWIAKRGATLCVHVRDERGSLPKRDELPSLWRFPYFMYSLRIVAAALKGE